MNNLQNTRVLITGVGIKPLEHIFRDIITNEPSHNELIIDDQVFKINIGTAIALECARKGSIVAICSRTQANLEKIRDWICSEVPDAIIEIYPCDLSDLNSMATMINSIPDNRPLYWVQSAGLGAGTIKLKDDNPYIPIENIGDDLIDAELSVIKSTIQLFQLLLPRFRRQVETKICVVTSMSAVRSPVPGAIHAAAKGGLSRFVNAAALEYAKEKIFITDVRPGAIDTGIYDNSAVMNSVFEIYKSYGCDTPSPTKLALAPPSEVANLITTALASKSHILSINMVARGQMANNAS